jgi:NitT/TauT family transport system permease protein/taurine transport system permease protein
VVVLIAWEAAYRAGLLNPMVFGSPMLVVKAALSDGQEFIDALRTTAFEILVAILISWVGGIAFGALAGSVEIVARISSPILAAMIALPFVILYPVLMIWFGIGPASKIAFGVLLGVFPIALNTMVGVASIDKGYSRMARSIGASRMQAVAQVTIPLALPTVLAGLRLGTSLIVIGVILTEMLASTDGIGYLISYHRSLFDTGHVLLGIIIGLVLAAIANWALTWVEHRYGNWRVAQQDLG